MLSFWTGPEDPVEDMEEVSRVVLLIHLWAEPMIRNEQNIHWSRTMRTTGSVVLTQPPPLTHPSPPKICKSIRRNKKWATRDIVLLLRTGVVVHILWLNVLFRLSGHLQENPQVERVTWLEKEATIYVLIEYITISAHDKITTIYSIIRVSINKRITFC